MAKDKPEDFGLGEENLRRHNERFLEENEDAFEFDEIKEEDDEDKQ